MERAGGNFLTWISIGTIFIGGIGSYFTLTTNVENLSDRVVVLESAKPQVLANEIKGLKEDIQEIKQSNDKLEAKIDRLVDIALRNSN